jgi:deoxyadenosine/deoxycytidine kinase
MDGVLVVSGIPGSGKTTVARLLAEHYERGVHIEGDHVGEHFIVRGFVPPQGPPRDEGGHQLLLRRRNVCLLADSFTDGGFTTIVDDVVVSRSILDLYLDYLHARPLRLVQLTPSLDVVAQRDAERDKHFFDLWGHLHEELHERMDRVGFWLDTSELSPCETVDAIVNNLDATQVSPAR